MTSYQEQQRDSPGSLVQQSRGAAQEAHLLLFTFVLFLPFLVFLFRSGPPFQQGLHHVAGL